MVFLSSPVFKFNDYKKKQERNILVTNLGVYNLKGNSTYFIIKPSNAKLILTKLKPLLSAKLEPNLSSMSQKNMITGRNIVI